MRKQFIGVILLMMGMDNLYNLKDSGVPLAQFESGQWAALVVSIVMVGLGLYLSIVGWLEFRKTMEEREREKKEAQENFDLNALSENVEPDAGSVEGTDTEEEEGSTDKYLE